MAIHLPKDTKRPTLPTDRNGVPLQGVWHPTDGGQATVDETTTGAGTFSLTVSPAGGTDVIRLAVSGGGALVVFGDSDSPAPDTSSGFPLLQSVGGAPEYFNFKGYTTIYFQRVSSNCTLYATPITDRRDQV